MRFNRMALLSTLLLLAGSVDVFGQDASFHPVVLNRRLFGHLGGETEVAYPCSSCDITDGYGEFGTAPLKPSLVLDIKNVMLDIFRCGDNPPRCPMSNCALPRYRPYHYYATPLAFFSFRWGCFKGPGCLCHCGYDHVESEGTWDEAPAEYLEAPEPPELTGVESELAQFASNATPTLEPEPRTVRIIQPWKSRGVVTTENWNGRPVNGMIFSSQTRGRAKPRTTQILRLPARID